MRLPRPVSVRQGSKLTQVRFMGYDAMGTEGAICDMKNLCGDYWPELAVRPKRRTLDKLEKPNGLFSAEGLMWVDGKVLHDNSFGQTVELGGSDAWQRSVAVLGAYVTIWPDGVYYRKYLDEYGTMQYENGSLDTGIHGPAYITTSSVTVPGADVSVFRVGDAVTIRDCAWQPDNNKTAVIREIRDGVLMFSDECFKTRAYLSATGPLAAGNYRVVSELLKKKYYVELPQMSAGDTFMIDVQKVIVAGEEYAEIVLGGEAARLELLEEGAVADPSMETMSLAEEWAGEYIEDLQDVSVSRDVPVLDFVFEHGNRLMGCCGDVIYVSKLGDPFNWNVFDGTASDSWTIETGTFGKFTGACVYEGYPRFFKEDLMFTLYGDYPGEYQLQRLDCMGVKENCGKSLVAVNGRLFWLSRSGPCVFSGGVPGFAADVFGLKRYSEGAAGGDGKKYWLSMKDGQGLWHLFVYDTVKGLWMREDDLQAVDFAWYRGQLYCLAVSGEILALGRPEREEGTEETGPVDWFAEFGDFTDGYPDKKAVSKLQLRLEMEEGAAMQVLMRFEGEEKWVPVASLEAKRKRSVVLPIVPRRLDHYRIRLEGKGGARISSLARQTAAGSER